MRCCCFVLQEFAAVTHTPSRAALVFLAALTLGLTACTAGPSSSASGGAARTGWFPGSTLALGADGDWSAASAQQFTASGFDMGNDRLSAMGAQGSNGFRVTDQAVSFMSSGNLKISDLVVKFAEPQLAAGEDAGEAIASAIVESWKVGTLEIDNAAFYTMITEVSDVFGALGMALGAEATAQVKASLEAAQKITETTSPGATAILQAAITALSGGAL